MSTQNRLQYLEQELAKYLPKFLEKKKHFRGIRHEDSLSELRYTEYMVYKDIVENLIKQIDEIKLQSKR